MNTTALKTVWLTAGFVLLFALMPLVNMPIDFILALFAIGIVLIPYMVVSVLKDPYSTRKTFSDWYEDHPKS